MSMMFFVKLNDIGTTCNIVILVLFYLS